MPGSYIGSSPPVLNPVDSRPTSPARLQGFSPAADSSYHRGSPRCVPVLVLIAALVGLLLLVGAGARLRLRPRPRRGDRQGRPRRRRRRERADRGRGARQAARAVLDPLKPPGRGRGRSASASRSRPRGAKVGVDIDGSVRAAMDAHAARATCSSRTWRGIRGEPRRRRARARHRATRRSRSTASSARVGKAVDKPAVDASVDLESGDVAPQPSEDGRRLLAKRLERQVTRAAARRRRRQDREGAARRSSTPEVTTERARREVPGDPVRGPRQLPARRSTRTSSWPRRTASRSARSDSRRRPGSTTSRTRR